MPRSVDMRRADLRDWYVDVLRLTLFIAPKFAIKIKDVESLWSKTIGENPDTSIRKPKIDELVDSGPYDGGVLALQVTHRGSRIDWFLGTPSYTAEKSEPRRYTERLESFSKIMAGWLGVRGAVTRMAFGIQVYLRFKERNISFEMLKNYIHLDADPENTANLLYQINRRRDSYVMPGRKINRLMRWSLRGESLVRIEHAAGSSEISPEVSQEEVMSLVQLELDINTEPLPQDATLQRDKLSELYGELVSLADEILRQGDIP